MQKSLFDTQIDILLEEGKSLKSGLTRKALVNFFKGKEDEVLQNGIVLTSYGKHPPLEDEDGDLQSRAIVALAEKRLTKDERIVFRNSIGGKTCVIIGKPATELTRLAVCDLEHTSTISGELTGVPCKFPLRRKMKTFGDARLKDAYPKQTDEYDE